MGVISDKKEENHIGHRLCSKQPSFEETEIPARKNTRTPADLVLSIDLVVHSRLSLNIAHTEFQKKVHPRGNTGKF